jgi:ribosomal protein S27AE
LRRTEISSAFPWPGSPPGCRSRRIPEGWLRLLNCGPGWYPLLVDLDQELANLDPEYTVHQVKQKFAELRYYFETANDAVAEEMYDLTVVARERSKNICEMCGEPGSLMHRHLTVRTLCEKCGRTTGFEPAPTKGRDKE